MRDPLKLAAIAVLAFACSESEDAGKGPAPADPITDPKSDSFRAPVEHGKVTFGTRVETAFAEGARFHAFDFELSGSASVKITTDSTDTDRDTVAYLYESADGAWGRYLEKNDDYDPGTFFSQISADLGAGKFRVLVRGYSRAEKGDFGVVVDCTGDGCGATTPPPMDAQETCIFGERYHDLEISPALKVLGEAFVDASNVTEAQKPFVLAGVQAAYEEASTIEEAFESTDENGVNYTTLVDRFDGTEYVAVEYGAGDNSYGAIFGADPSVTAAKISDGDLWPCNVADDPSRYELNVVDGELPEALEGLDAHAGTLEGLPEGKAVSLASRGALLDAANKIFADPCYGVPSSADGTPVRLYRYDAAYRFQDRESWERAPKGEALDNLVYWLEDGEDDIDTYTVALLGEACGGSGSGELAMFHDRRDGAFVYLVMFEATE